LAFPDFSVRLNKRIKTVGSFEFWNLKKIEKNEFIDLIKTKIRPLNKNIRNNYFSSSTKDHFLKAYDEASWGILVPSSLDDFGSENKLLFIINQFTDKILPLVFHVSNFGIKIDNAEIKLLHKVLLHGVDKDFSNIKFVGFFRTLINEIKETGWQAYQVLKWDREMWRLSNLYSLIFELQKYKNSKDVLSWPKECRDFITIYETMLTRHKNDGGKHKIIQRIEVLIGEYFKKDFNKIKRELDKVYEYRNEYVHGQSFDRLKRETRSYPDNTEMAKLPSVDFDFLNRQARILRKVFIVFLFLRKKFKNTRSKKIKNKTIPEIIELGIMDFVVRKKIQKYAKEILSLSS
jgi:hypothetical protein